MTNVNKNKWNELQERLSQHSFLTSNNPVITHLKSGDLMPHHGAEILKQYFYLVATIVQFLTIAMVRIPAPRAKKELLRNLQEELGSRTNGVPHQDLLEALLFTEMGIAARTPWNKHTQRFISELLLDFHIQSPIFVAGMIYALEATACPELIVVAEIINLVAEKEVVDLAKLQDRNCATAAKQNDALTLQSFLSLHTLDFEVGHESGLRTTLDEFVSNDWEEFVRGFNSVIWSMDSWWEQLRYERITRLTH